MFFLNNQKAGAESCFQFLKLGSLYIYIYIYMPGTFTFIEYPFGRNVRIVFPDIRVRNS